MRPPHQIPGGPMGPDNMPPQMRRSMSIDLARPMGGNPQMGNPQMGLPQHFPPRAIPMQQHNIMGQPFIELRHRAPENRMRLPFRPMGPMEQPGQRPPHGFIPTGQDMGFHGPQGQRMMDPMLGQPQQGALGPMQMGANMEAIQHQQQQQANMQMNSGQQHPPLSRSMSQPTQSETLNVPQPGLLPAAGQPEELPLPTGEGIEEKLDTDDSAVKDLEDVEVKDLVDDDLETLNLDGEDGLHLDDFLTSGKFDLIAYADPELDLEDKKDMFNEELDLADPMEDDHGEASDLQKALSEKRNASTDVAAVASSSAQPMGKADNLQLPNQVKKEDCTSAEGPAGLHIGKTIKIEGTPCPVSSQEHGAICGQPSVNSSGIPGDHTGLFGASTDPLSGSAPVLSSLLIKEKREDQGLGAVVQPHPSAHGPGLQQNMALMTGQALDPGMNPAMGLSSRVDPSLAQGAQQMTNPQMMQPANPKMQVPGFGGPGGQQVDLNMPPMMGGQPPGPPHGLGRQSQPGMFPLGGMGQQQPLPQQPPPQVAAQPPQPPASASQHNRPLLLDEQPLLLQDLLDQERQEQQQQRQMQAMIRQRSDSFFPNIGKSPFWFPSQM